MKILSLFLLLTSVSFGITLKVRVTLTLSEPFPQSNLESIEITSSKSLSNEKEYSSHLGLIPSNKKKSFIFKNNLGLKDQPTNVILSQLKETLALLLDKETSAIPINSEQIWSEGISLKILGDFLEDFLITEGFEVTHRDKKDIFLHGTTTYELLLYLKK